MSNIFERTLNEEIEKKEKQIERAKIRLDVLKGEWNGLVMSRCLLQEDDQRTFKIAQEVKLSTKKEI